MQVIAAVALGLSLAVLSTAGRAGTINFEELPHDTALEPTIASQGYRLELAGDFALVLGNANEGLQMSGNGTKRLVAFNSSAIILSRQGGGAFDLLRFDGGESWTSLPHLWATQLRVEGQLAGGGSIAQVFSLDLQKDILTGLQQFVLGDGFRDLLSVRFSGIGGNPEFTLDNLVVDAQAANVDAPSSAWLAVAGLASLGALRRRRRISSAAAAR